jgi:hypothetical protein
MVLLHKIGKKCVIVQGLWLQISLKLIFALVVTVTIASCIYNIN